MCGLVLRGAVVSWLVNAIRLGPLCVCVGVQGSQ